MTKPCSRRLSLIPVSEIVAQLAGRAEALCCELLPAGHREGMEWRCGSVEGEPGKSLGVCLAGAKIGKWSDFAADGRGDLLDLIQACLGLDKGEAVQWAKGWLGIDDDTGIQPCVRHRRPGLEHHNPPRQNNPNRPAALKIWRATQPAPGTLAEDYLRGRGVTTSIPPTIRYHSSLKHTDTGLHLPCLITAACNVDRKITGIQRTYLTLDDRKASVNRPKMALGTLRGSAVRLAPTTDRVCLTEGVEDALALTQMTGDPAWALLGAGNFKTVELPKNITQVLLAPDGDEKGQGMIQGAAIRLAGQGREVRAAKMPAGKDWVDVLEEYEKRAGILEFDFHMTRHEAEVQARLEILNG